MMTAAQKAKRDTVITDILDACQDIHGDEFLGVLEDIIQHTRGVTPARLEAFAQRLSRHADELERQSR